MTLAWQLARGAAVVAVMLIAFSLLPSADTTDPYYATPLTIPDAIWTPLVGILQLDRYFPIHELLNTAYAGLAILVGMVGWWLVSWIIGKVAD